MRTGAHGADTGGEIRAFDLPSMRRSMPRPSAPRPLATGFLLGWAGLAVVGGARLLLDTGPLPASECLLIGALLVERVHAERRAGRQADAQQARARAARESAQRALDEKSRFMAAVTHDLQQPLYALRMATDVLGRQALRAADAQALLQMRSALHAADELVTSMLMAVRLEHSELDPRPETFSVQEMLERIEALFAAQARHKGLSWRVRPSLALVHTDPLLLERMLSNLVSNAMRYTDRGGVLLACRERGDTLLVQVWDTGRGLTPDERDTVFQPHVRGSAARRHDQGLGLGLAIVARCAQLLGIGVALRTAPGRGSCFELRVPRARPSA